MKEKNLRAKEHVWTEPGPIDPEAYAAAEARKGTAAANPVLSLAPKPTAAVRRTGTTGATAYRGTGGGAGARVVVGTAAGHGTGSGTGARSGVGTVTEYRGAGGGAAATSAAPEPDHRSPAEIEADIEQTRNRLAGTLDELTERLTPRALLRQANARARGVFVHGDGSVRKDRVAMAAGAVTSVLGGAVALRKLKPSRS